MRKVKCHECGRGYDYDVDDFCPKCGAFTQPARAAHIGADGSVIRNDGINEQGHHNSFVHSEYHAENRKRDNSWLEGVKGSHKISLKSVRREKSAAGGKGGAGSLFAKLVFAFIALNVLSAILNMI